MTAYRAPVGFIDEAGKPVLLPKPRAWLGAKDQTYSDELERARTYYASDLLYSADDFNALRAQYDALLERCAGLDAAAETHTKVNPHG